MKNSLDRRIGFVLFAAAYLWVFFQFRAGITASWFGPNTESGSIAGRLLTTGQFSDPFNYPTGPTAHLAPVYPVIVALFFLTPFAALFLALFNATVLGTGAVLLAAISRRIFGNVFAAVAAATLFILGSRVALHFEAFLAATLMLAAAYASLRERKAAASIWCGLSFLTNPASLLSLPLIAAIRGRRFAAIVSGSALLMCVPWIARNWIVLGAPYFVRDNLGFELYLSNADSSTAEMEVNPVFISQHPGLNRSEAAKVAFYGESRYYRMRFQNAIGWITAHPKKFLSLTAQRIWYYWFPSLREGWQAYPYWAITVLGFTGAWLSRRNKIVSLWFLAGIAYSLLYVFIQASARYRYPSLWIQSLPAGYALAVALNQLSILFGSKRGGHREVAAPDGWCPVLGRMESAQSDRS